MSLKKIKIGFSVMVLALFCTGFFIPSINKINAETTTVTTPVISSITTSVVTPTIFTTPRTLKFTTPRIKGDDVKALQTFLNNSGYNCGIVDGSFGPKTEAQVKLFQKANNLTPDGKAGKITLSLISNTSPTGSVPTAGCTSTTGFSTTTGKSCATISLPTGCSSTSLFSITTGLSCGIIPTGCTPTPTTVYVTPTGFIYSTFTGNSCVAGLAAPTQVIKIIGGGSSGPSIQKVSPTTMILGQDGLTYGTVTGADGRIWLDRNLGATQVATAFDDTQAYGDLYQWGRAYDGHQSRTSLTSSTLSSTDQVSAPDTAKFITSSDMFPDWRSSQNNNLWQGVNGVNNVCPAGFRLPTNTEQQTLITAAGITNMATAFSSSLKFTAAGGRYSSDASLNDLGMNGYYWSSSVGGWGSLNFDFNSSTVIPADEYARAYGFTVRCIQEFTTPSSITLTVGSTNPVGGVTNVSIPESGATDSTGGATGWVTGTADKIKFTVVNGGSATSTITINGSAYTSGADYTIPSASPLTIVVTTREEGKATGTRTFNVSVVAPGFYAIRGTGPSGGLVFYTTDGGLHGLEAAPTDQSTGITWAIAANQTTSVAGTSTAIGTGSANTNLIIAQNGAGSTYAAGLARAYNGGGKSDWFLPSFDELNNMYINLQKGTDESSATYTPVGNFTDTYYWSSSEVSGYYFSCWVQGFLSYGGTGQYGKDSLLYVRAVRAF